MEISSFDDFAQRIRDFETWGDSGGYDFGGAVILLGACLDNLEKHALPAELEELTDRLEPSQITFLLKVAQTIRSGNTPR
jgi:hypothetical protein